MTSSQNNPPQSDNHRSAGEEASPRNWLKWLKGMGLGTIIFFTVKGIITTGLIFGAWTWLRSCAS